MKKIKKLRLITILLLSMCVFCFMGTTAHADGSVAVTGTFSSYDYKIVQGETVSSPLVNVIFINNYDYEITLQLYQRVPDGVNIQLDDEFVTLAPNSRIDIPIVISVAEDAIPGEYDIYVQAKLIKDKISGKINVGAEYALRTKLTIFGEAADMSIDVVDVAGEPIRAVMNLYQLTDNLKVPLAYSDIGVITERVIPGDYEVIAFWHDYQLARHAFTLTTDQNYQKTLVAETVQIYAFTVSPVFVENTDDELATANLRFILHNIYKELNNSRVKLVVYKNGDPLEERDIFRYNTLEVDQHELGLHYVPAQGWDKAEYTFKLEFYVDEHNDNGDIVNSTLYASSMPTVLDVSSGFSFKKFGEFFSGRLIILVLIAGLLVGIYFLARYLMERSPKPKAPVTQVPSRCPDCGGKGTLTCPECFGKGTTLYGTIEEECLYCNGIGEVICDTCVNPKNLVTCPKCSGNGYVTRGGEQVECTYCNGLGHVLMNNKMKYKDGVKYKLGKPKDVQINEPDNK